MSPRKQIVPTKLPVMQKTNEERQNDDSQRIVKNTDKQLVYYKNGSSNGSSDVNLNRPENDKSIKSFLKSLNHSSWKSLTIKNAMHTNVNVNGSGADTVMTEQINNQPKKRHYNVEVDPARYRKIEDENGVRYACSLCGNIYKWRKSLNKHWKEKHMNELPPPLDAPAPLKDKSGYPNTAARNCTLKAASLPTNQQRVKSKCIELNQRSQTKILHTAESQKVTHPAFHVSLKRNLKNSQLEVNAADCEQETYMEEMSSRKKKRKFSATSSDSVHLSHLDHYRQAPYYSSTSSSPFSNTSLSKAQAINHPSVNTFHEEELSCSLGSDEPLDLSIRNNLCSDSSGSASSRLCLENIVQKDECLQKQPNISTNESTVNIDEKSLDGAELGGNSVKPELDENNVVQNRDFLDFCTNRFLVCNVCFATFVSLDQLNQHFTECHLDAIEREFQDKTSLRNTNVAQQNANCMLSSPDNPLKCAQCGFVGRWPTELQKHSATHSTARPHKCIICSSTYKWRWDLAKHFERAHSAFPNPYKRRDRGDSLTFVACNISISKTTTSLKRRHSSSPKKITSNEQNKKTIKRMRAESDDPCHPVAIKFVVPPEEHPLVVKETSFCKSQSLDSERNPLSLSPPVYNKCKEAEKSRSTTNNENKHFHCQWCKYMGRWKSELLQHMRCCHAKDKPFHCSLCTYGSNWKWDVQKHVNKQHGGCTNHLEGDCGGAVVKTRNSQSRKVKRQQQPLYDSTNNAAMFVIEIPDEYLFYEPVTNEYVELNVKDPLLKSKLLTLLERARGPFLCDICPFAGVSQSELDKHKNVHHPTTANETDGSSESSSKEESI